MDADYDPEMVAPPTKKSKLSRRRHKLARAITTHKPQFDPEEETFEEYFDEYYSLDYEDVIGDLPCRFKYKQVPANSFGLSVEEVKLKIYYIYTFFHNYYRKTADLSA